VCRRLVHKDRWGINAFAFVVGSRITRKKDVVRSFGAF